MGVTRNWKVFSPVDLILLTFILLDDVYVYRFTSANSAAKDVHPLDPVVSNGESKPRTIVFYIIGGISPIELIQLEDVLSQFKNSQELKVIVGSTNLVSPIDILYNVCNNPCS